MNLLLFMTHPFINAWFSSVVGSGKFAGGSFHIKKNPLCSRLASVRHYRWGGRIRARGQIEATFSLSTGFRAMMWGQQSSSHNRAISACPLGMSITHASSFDVDISWERREPRLNAKLRVQVCPGAVLRHDTMTKPVLERLPIQGDFEDFVPMHGIK